MTVLLEYEKAAAMLEKYKVRSVQGRYIKSPDEAAALVKGGPIAMKAISGKALHKTKAGLIVLNISTADGAKSAFKTLTKNAAKYKPFKILAQRMVNGGTEIIIGGKVDPQFGKMILIGLGGVYVEAFRDFALRVCPITKGDAASMLDQLRSKNVVAPDEATRRMLVDLLMRVSDIIVGNDIVELDLNPVILHDGTYDTVDLRVLK